MLGVPSEYWVCLIVVAMEGMASSWYDVASHADLDLLSLAKVSVDEWAAIGRVARHVVAGSRSM
jgi:hypothetical protein